MDRLQRLVAVAVAAGTPACAAPDAAPNFDIRAVISVGDNPHQIVFTSDGTTAYVASAGSNRVAEVDVATHTVRGYTPVPDSPLGIALAPGGDLAVTRFGADQIVRIPPGDTVPTSRLETGGAPSLLVGPLPDGSYLVSVEQANLVRRVDLADFSLRESYETGTRPFPAAATSDGRLAYVPNYDDGTVTAIDLREERIVATTPVGTRPSGGAVLPGDTVYAVALRGDNRIVFVSTASHQVADSLSAGIGDGPFSVVVSPNGRLAFVNNTASNDISVIDLAARRVIARVPVGETPIVMAVHPSGDALWVSSEGRWSQEVTVVEIPETWRGVD